MNAFCLPFHLGQLKRVFNLFWLFTKLARTSRRETRSSMIPPLEEAFRGSKEQREKQQAPSSPCFETHQSGQDRQGDGQLDSPGCQAFPPLAGVDIWNTYCAGCAYVHLTWSLSLPVCHLGKPHTRHFARPGRRCRPVWCLRPSNRAACGCR